MNYVINWNIFKHPLNWLTVTLMVLIAMLFFHFMALHIKQHAAS